MHPKIATGERPEQDQSHSINFSIGDLAQEFGITTRTIRYYEQQGLLDPERHGIQRLYQRRDKIRLKLILRGKRLGFSLVEIAEMIAMYDAESGEIGQLHYFLERIDDRKQRLIQQSHDIEQTLAALSRIEQGCREQLAVLEQHSRD
ncbi:MAG TPA: MerR family DNA-binding transcriptional regulator [Gammaproteobacteria bacterium]|nr:MerR family DNA-binding transcriptional regulator [Gammaproteobacteria bacterium]